MSDRILVMRGAELRENSPPRMLRRKESYNVP